MSTNKKALFFDIDGTILSEVTGKIPESASAALQKAHDLGHLLFINTGRTICCLPPMICRLPFSGYLCGCGSYIVYNDEVLTSTQIPKERQAEIIRQVKLAYESAKTRQMTDGDLNVIFQSALQLAKEIADQSMMTRLPVSVGTLTTLDALQFCAGKEEPHILLVGASGDIGSIVLRDLVDADDRVRIVATSRKHKQYELAFQDTEQVRWVHYDNRYEYLGWADVVISATSSPHYIFLEENVKKVWREKPLCFIDLAIPRDVDEAIEQLEGCIVKNMDDIQALAKKNNEKKLTEAKKIALIIEDRVEEMEKTLAFRRFRDAFPEKMEQLEEKKASWLLYQLREHLDLEAFEQVIKSLEGES